MNWYAEALHHELRVHADETIPDRLKSAMIN